MLDFFDSLKDGSKAVLFCFLYTSNTPIMAMPTTTRAIIA